MKRVWVLLFWIGYAAAGVRAADGGLHILTSFLPVYCFAANVAGEYATVENLLPGAVSPHDYQLSTGDLRKIGKADLILINGLGVESFIEKAIRNSGPGTAAKIVRVSDGLTGLIPLQGGAGAQKSAQWDPHIWLDPVLAMACVSNVVSALSKADPAHAADFQRNGAAYAARLKKLDDEIRETLGPVKDVPFITYHAAFGYFVRRYDLRLAGVVEKTPEVPPSARDMSELLRTIREQKVKALFTEPAAGSRLSKQIARDAEIALGELDPLETGALSAKIYEEGMRKNAVTLLEALR